MIERIQAIYVESAWLMEKVLDFDFNVELALRHGKAALDDLQATDNPTMHRSRRFFQRWQI